MTVDKQNDGGMRSRKFLVVVGTIIIMVGFALIVFFRLSDNPQAWDYLSSFTSTVFTVVLPGYLVANIGEKYVARK